MIYKKKNKERKTTRSFRKKQQSMKYTELLKSMNHSGLKISVNFSDKASLFELPDLYKHAKSTQKIMTLFGEENGIYSYNDMGIYQLFTEIDDLNQLEKLVPKALISLKETHPDLVETLKVFLDHNQNYKETADQLFLHPKTVRYRLDKIKKFTAIQFDHAEELLQINVGLRLLKLIEK